MSKISYQFVAHPTGEQKLPPQAKTILLELENAGNNDDGTPVIVSRDQLVKDLTIDDEKNKLNARQPVERVIAFYQNRLESEGFLKVIKAAAEPKAPKAPKEKKAGKSKAPIAGTADDAAEVGVDPENVAAGLMA